MHRYPPLIFAALALALLTGDRTPGCDQTRPARRVVRCRAKFVDSKRATDALSAKAVALMEAGKTVPMAKLIAQLSRKRCELTLPAPADRPLDSATLYEKRKPATLLVGHLSKCDDCTDWHFNPASGFVLTRGVAVTNYHVVDQRREKTMVVASAAGEVYPVTEVLAASKRDDVALVRFTGGDDLPAIPLAGKVRIGTPIHVISHPQGRLYMLTRGIVAGLYQERSPTMVVTADFAQGSSGGPVIDANGNIAGIVTATHSVYAADDRGGQADVQMVEKLCVPVGRIRALIKIKEKTR